MPDPNETPNQPRAETAMQPKKRSRVQFSCTACRHRKLKCCRTHPCTNCTKRGDAESCTFVGRGLRARAQAHSSPTLVQDRLQHLENLVMSLSQQQGQMQSTGLDNSRPDNVFGYDTPPSATERDAKSPPQDPGTLVADREGTAYIDSANWRAILEEIHGVREYIEDTENSEGEDDLYEETSPVLLLGISKPVSKEEILADIPPREIADRLISRILKSSEPTLVMIHLPTFQREYEKFWENPHAMSFTWISLLFSIMAVAVSLYRRAEEPLPLNLEDPMKFWDIFRKRSAQCLVQGNYLAPGRYKCETLFLYAFCEFYRSQDAQIGVSYIVGICIRLAMRMGYHRDPRHYPSLTAWEGEMRRRVWAMLGQIDTLVSFQVGLPRTIQHWIADTQPPSNLLDTDFDEDTVDLPPGRPITERTPSSYTIGKHRIMMIFGQISDLAFSREQVSYDDILDLDRRLGEAHSKLPHFYQYKAMAQCIADPSDIVLRRYTIEILYQKARVVLHRRYMGETHSKYAFSRSACLSAAKRTLQHHAEVWKESLPGGQLYTERFFINSLQNTDFMLSAMIICLALSQEQSALTRLSDQERVELVSLLETTRRAFKETQRQSVDTQRAFAALTIMLSRVRGESVQNLMSEPEPHNLINGQSIAPSTSIDHQYIPFTPGDTLGTYDLNPSYSSLDVIGDMLNTPAQLDWSLYDSRVFGFQRGSQDGVWHTGDAIGQNSMDFGFFPSNETFFS